MSAAGIFLDRDGVLNELVLHPPTGAYESPHRRADLRMLPGAAEAARALHEAGFLLFIVSNQPDFAKGKATLEEIQAIAAAVEQHLQAAGAPLAATYYCYHHPDFTGPCECRKPSPHFLLQAAQAFALDLSQSWMIGDQESDVECGRRAGCRTVLIAAAHSAPRRPGREQPTLTAADLPDAVRQVLARAQRARS